MWAAFPRKPSSLRTRPVRCKGGRPFRRADGNPVGIDFPAVMERMRKLRADLSPHDSARRFAKLGVDVFLGEARFAGPDTIEVAGQMLRFKRAVIATGARAVEPPSGLAEAGYPDQRNGIQSYSVSGPACVHRWRTDWLRVAQAFQRWVPRSACSTKTRTCWNREDIEAAALVQKALLREGIALRLNATITRIERSAGGRLIYYEAQGKEETFAVDEILAGAAVRRISRAQLEAAGVNYDQRKGVLVNDYLQTSNPHVYGAGDVCLDGIHPCRRFFAGS